MKKLMIFILITFLTLINIIPSLTGITDYKITSVVNETSKKIIVEAPLPRELPTQARYWKSESKKMTGLLKRLDATIDLTVPEYTFSRIEVPIENYEELVNSLESRGYMVHDEILLKPKLNESINAIGGRYEYDSSELTGVGSIITIIDSGIDCMHQDFGSDCNKDNLGKILTWSDPLYGFDDIQDITGHGTHAASIAAGYGTASDGKYEGVAPGAGLKIVRACTALGCSVDNLIEGIQWAINDGTDIISLSYGEENPTTDMCIGSSSAPAEFKWVYDNITDAINNHNVKFVASAGNSGPKSGNINFPGCMNDVIAVGSTFKKDYSCITEAGWGYRCWWHKATQPLDSTILYEIKVTSEDQDLIWGAWSGSRNGWSGILEVFEPRVWPATIRVKVQGKNTLRNCWPGECNGVCESWDPGGPEEGNPDNPADDDEFWIWEGEDYEFSYNPDAPYIVVELFNYPEGESWWCIEGDGWHYWYTQDRIYVNAYRTNAVSTQGLVVYSSSRGPAPQGKTKPDIVAPGQDICAARAYDFYSDKLYCDDNDYASLSGTSFAAPHVSGLIALLLEAKPGATRTEILDALKKADEKMLEGHPDNSEGHGVINVQNAVNFITCDYDKTSLDGKCHEVCGADPECEEVEPNTGWCDYNWVKNCDWTCGYSSEDCSPRVVDTDGGINYENKGTCTDYDGCSGGNCQKMSYTDDCEGSYSLREYYVSGSSCGSQIIDCRDYDHAECKWGECGTWVPFAWGGGGDMPGGALMTAW